MSHDERARISLLSTDKMTEFNQTFEVRHHLLNDFYFVVFFCRVGTPYYKIFSIVVKSPTNYFSNGFVFALTGRMNFSALNRPVNLHDLTLAELGDVYPDLEVIFEEIGAFYWYALRFQVLVIPSPSNLFKILFRAVIIRMSIEFSVKRIPPANRLNGP